MLFSLLSDALTRNLFLQIRKNFRKSWKIMKNQEKLIKKVKSNMTMRKKSPKIQFEIENILLQV